MDLGEGLRKAMARLTGATIIDAKTIREFNKELQRALISADVDVNLAFSLTKKIEDAALKEKLPEGVSARDYITNMVYDELVALMGGSFEPEIKPKRILLLGLYGAGKTTMAAKLAKFYQDRGLGAGLIACDVSRPAAYEQLELPVWRRSGFWMTSLESLELDALELPSGGEGEAHREAGQDGPL